MGKLTKEELLEIGIEEDLYEGDIPDEVKEEQKKGEDIDVYSYDEYNLTFYVKRPKRTHIQYFIDKMQDRATSFLDTQKKFVKSLIIYPNEDELDKIEKEYPAIYVSLSNTILDDVGLVTFTRGKLRNTKS